MENTKRKIAALEPKVCATDASLGLVIVADGETPADAMKRAGYPPDAANVLRVSFVGDDHAQP